MNDSSLPHSRCPGPTSDWEQVPIHPTSRRTASRSRTSPGGSCSPSPALACELRYFEMAPGGYSTLERHEHVHAVLILRGRGHCLVGAEVRPVGTATSSTFRP